MCVGAIGAACAAQEFCVSGICSLGECVTRDPNAADINALMKYEFNVLELANAEYPESRLLQEFEVNFRQLLTDYGYLVDHPIESRFLDPRGTGFQMLVFRITSQQMQDLWKDRCNFCVKIQESTVCPGISTYETTVVVTPVPSALSCATSIVVTRASDTAADASTDNNRGSSSAGQRSILIIIIVILLLIVIAVIGYFVKRRLNKKDTPRGSKVVPDDEITDPVDLDVSKRRVSNITGKLHGDDMSIGIDAAAVPSAGWVPPSQSVYDQQLLALLSFLLRRSYQITL